MAHDVCELLWVKSVLKVLGIEDAKPMSLHCDNKAAIEIAYNHVKPRTTTSLMNHDYAKFMVLLYVML